MVRHFAFFSQETGAYIREWRGPVAPSPRRATRDELDAWATSVSCPDDGEVGLDVTAIGWPVGDFCYCRLDLAQDPPLLEWGPPRHYVEIDLSTMAIVANQESHRPVRANPGRVVVDITGTALEPLWGSLFGRLRRRDGRIAVVPPRALGEAPMHLDPLVLPEAVTCRVSQS